MRLIKVVGSRKKEDINGLFYEYLKICNQAIEQHKDEFPYQQVLDLGEKIMGDQPINLAVYDDKPKAAFSLYFRNNKLEDGGLPHDVKKAWRVNLSYLRKVVENPKDYIAHPEKLDLEWLKSRLGF